MEREVESIPSASGVQRTASCFAPRVVLLLFCLVNLMTYYDRGAVGATLPSIRKDPGIRGAADVSGGLSDAKSGTIVSAFMVGFFVMCPVFAALGGRFSAKQIITFGLLVWIASCVSTGLSQNYWMLVISRCFVGVGEAAYAGYTVTIIDNIAPKASRTMWIGTYYSMIPVGTAVGMAAGGIIANTVVASIGHLHGGWRFVFLTEVIPMVPLLWMVACLPASYNPFQSSAATSTARRSTSTTTPPLAHQAKHEAHISLYSALPLLFKNTSYLLLVFGYAMYTFVIGAVAIWAISMLEQGPLEMTPVQASVFMGVATCVTGLLGSVAGGVLVDRMGGSVGRQGLIHCCKLMILLVSGAIPVGWTALFCENFWLFAPAFVFGVFLLFGVTAPATAAILSSVPSPLRTYAVSFSVFFIHLLGDFPSPVIAGAISDRFSNGCNAIKDLHSNVSCIALQQCRYYEAAGLQESSCVNKYQLRNSLMVIWSFLLLAIPAWAIALRRTAQHIASEFNDAEEYEACSWRGGSTKDSSDQDEDTERLAVMYSNSSSGDTPRGGGSSSVNSDAFENSHSLFANPSRSSSGKTAVAAPTTKAGRRPAKDLTISE